MAKTKKRKNKDFQKVKVKIGRKLKRANETLPQVKVGLIQIRNQFSTNAEALSGRKTSKIKELVKLCDNVKTLVRYNGVQQLRQSLTAEPNRLCNYFYRIFAMLPSLCIDEDAGIRSEARRLISWIFSSKEFDQLFDPGDPDLNLVLPYLRLAMNHSQEAVKIDSLALLDIYMMSPRLILFGAVSILKDLLVLISAQRRSQLGKTKSQSAGVDPSHGKRGLLSSNPVSRLAQQKWRSSVVERLNKFFQVLFEEICVNKSQRQVTKYGTCTAVTSVLSDPSTTQLLTENLIPLLFECWIETGFEKSGSEQMLDQVSINILQNTMKVMSSLVSIMTMPEIMSATKGSTFLVNFEKQCIQHFYSGFPFKIIQRGSKKDVVSKDVSVSFNVSVCYIMLRFESVGSTHSTEDFLQKLTSYILTVLEMPRPSLSSDLQEVVRILVKHLLHSKVEGLCEKLVTSTLNVLSGNVPKSDHQRNWFNLCSTLFVTSASDNYEQWTFLAKFPAVQKWFASLPDLYLEMGISQHQDCPKVIELIHQLIVLKQNTCREQFTKNLTLYLDESFLKHLQAVVSSGDVFFCYVARFLDVVRRASQIELSNLQLLVRGCLDGVIPSQNFAHFCDCIAQNFSGPVDDLPLASVDFLEFRNILMNAVVGGFQADLKATCEKYAVEINVKMVDHPGICVLQDQLTATELRDQWRRQREVVQNAIRTVGLLPDSVERLKEVLGFIKSVLETYRCMGILNACSLASAVCCCLHIAGPPFGPTLNAIGEFLCQPVTNLILGLVNCIDITISDKTLDEYMMTLPPLEVLVEVVQLYPAILDEFLTRTEQLVQGPKCSEEFIRKMFILTAVLKRDLKRDRSVNPAAKKTVEKLLQL